VAVYIGQVGNFATRVYVPNAHAIATSGRHQTAMAMNVHTPWPLSTLVPVQCSDFLARGQFPNARHILIPDRSEGASLAIRSEAAKLAIHGKQ
jgi:hypothetical protein